MRAGSNQERRQGIDLEPQFRLEPGMRTDGPAVIEETSSTTVVYIRQKAEVDEFLNGRILSEDSK
jgi:hypothetical protein